MASNARAARRRKAREAARIAAGPPAYIDLIHYVKLRTRCTTGTAKRVLLAGALKMDSHPVGYKLTKKGKKILDPLISADLRDRIVIAPVNKEAL